MFGIIMFAKDLNDFSPFIGRWCTNHLSSHDHTCDSKMRKNEK
jgi:hypothetical protein